ncbi:hypothetical protein MA16_Dca013378 [Dendrobium catenatum]|uniref:Uncharacterized protein n=1 Tax=Dendrobium catenatum TaxID=906689 RepID=A0A2I0VIW4_9ASPA|nr:hypothetical protein MA16_Dca013378 [Dendrobium catenatum]
MTAYSSSLSYRDQFLASIAPPLLSSSIPRLTTSDQAARTCDTSVKHDLQRVMPDHHSTKILSMSEGGSSAQSDEEE